MSVKYKADSITVTTSRYASFADIWKEAGKAVYIDHMVAVAPLGSNSSFTMYTKTTAYKRFNTIVASARARLLFQASDLREMPVFIEKGGMLKSEYNDDYTDDVSEVELGMRYLYIPPTVNG